MADEFVAPTFDEDFVVGVTADGELDGGLNDIVVGATEYSTAINNLIKYFNDNTLWQGEDAEALRTAALADGGPVKKLLEYEEELKKLSTLATNIRGAIGEAQEGLKKNVNTAMGTTNNGGAV